MTECKLLTREYIQSLIPDNIRNTWTFERVVDILLYDFSDQTKSGEKIKTYFTDIDSYVTDVTAISSSMKRAKINDNGFGYLFDYIELTDAQMNSVANFINLLKFYKGKKEGFDLLLYLLDLTYSYSSWLDGDYDGEIFTITLVFNVSSGEAISEKLAAKLRKLARYYLAPQAVIVLKVVEDVAFMNNYFSAGLKRKVTYPELEIEQRI